jgi:phage gpG-like protein
MAGDFDIRAEGLAELRRDLKATDREALKEVQKTLKGAADIAARTASELAPRKTGALARSYRPFTRGNIAGVGSTLPYAPVIEFGGTIRPKGTAIKIRRYEPVMRAAERQRDAIVDHLGDGIEAAARRTGWH